MKVGSVVILKRSFAHWGWFCSHCQSADCKSIGIVLNILNVNCEDDDLMHPKIANIRIFMNCKNAIDDHIFYDGFENKKQYIESVISE